MRPTRASHDAPVKHLLTATGAVAALVGATVSAGLSLSPPAGAEANTIVPCGRVSGPAGLVEAIKHANAAGGGTISLSRGCVYTLTTIDHDEDGLPEIGSQITINGNGASIVRRTTPPTPQFRILDVRSGHLTINALTVRGGKTDLGGGILDEAALTVNGSQVSGNAAGHFGGGIYIAGGAASVTNSRVTDNVAGEDGGGVDQSGRQLTLTSSQIVHNRAGGFGGGIDNGSKLDVAGSQVNGNAAFLGGGIANENSATPGAATATISRSQVNDNTASSPIGGAPFGGGLLNDASSTMQLVSAQVHGNTVSAPGKAAKGGGITNRGELTVRSSTLDGNAASAPGGLAQGGGLFNFGGGAVNLTQSLVSANRAVGLTAAGGGIFNADGTVALAASLVVNNVPNNCRPPASVSGCAG